MEHNELTKFATERYLLEEMPDAERDQFEAHFFSCDECAAEVTAGVQMMAAGRQVVREPVAPVVPFKKNETRSWRQWFPQTAAASVIAASVGWFGAVNTMRPVAVTVPAPFVAKSAQFDLVQAERAEAATKTIPAGKPAILNFDIPPPDDEAVSFVFAVRDASGKVWLTDTASLKEAANPVSLVLFALPRGKYEVVIEAVRKGGQRAPVPGVTFNAVEEGQR